MKQAFPHPSLGEGMRAFTLVEVIVGLALLIVLVGGAYGMLLRLQSSQREIAHLTARNSAGAAIIDAVERAVLTCVADAGADGTGVAVTGSSLRIVYRGMSPDMPTTDDAFSTRSRLAILHDAAAGSAEVTVTHGARTQTGTLTGIERIRFRAYDGEEWVEEFDAKAAGRLPGAVEVAIWFERGRGGASMAPGVDDEGDEEPREWREPDRLRVVAVFDSAGEDIPAVAEGGSEPDAGGES